MYVDVLPQDATESEGTIGIITTCAGLNAHLQRKLRPRPSEPNVRSKLLDSSGPLLSHSLIGAGGSGPSPSRRSGGRKRYVANFIGTLTIH